MSTAALGSFCWGRVVNAAEKIEQRRGRAVAALEGAGIPYAIIGGNAVAAWVSRVDDSVVRQTKDVDILLRAEDLEAAKAALAPAGFIHRHSAGMDLFLDGPGAKARDVLQVLTAGKKVRSDDPLPAPAVEESVESDKGRVLDLPALLRMKLVANRDRDRTHIRDLISVGLIDATWIDRVPPELAPRLQHILDTPEG